MPSRIASISLGCAAAHVARGREDNGRRAVGRAAKPIRDRLARARLEDARGEGRLRGVGVIWPLFRASPACGEADLDIFDAIGIDAIRLQVAPQHDVQKRAEAGYTDGLALRSLVFSMPDPTRRDEHVPDNG